MPSVVLNYIEENDILIANLRKLQIAFEDWGTVVPNIGITFNNSDNVSNTMVNFVISDAEKGITVNNSTAYFNLTF